MRGRYTRYKGNQSSRTPPRVERAATEYVELRSSALKASYGEDVDVPYSSGCKVPGGMSDTPIVRIHQTGHFLWQAKSIAQWFVTGYTLVPIVQHQL